MSTDDRQYPRDELQSVAETLLLRAGALALEYFRVPLAVEDKGRAGFDPVTAADRAVEALLRKGLAERYPDHAIVGEEQGGDADGASCRWLIDPIDGTRAFITGMPLWGILLGLLREGHPVLGFMHQPYLEELFGGDGEHAWLLRRNERRTLRTADTAELAAASLYTTHPDLFSRAADARAFDALARHCRLQRFGGDCYNYCMLAAGGIDLVVESGLSDYDILPLVPILEGAGAVVSDWEGAPLRTGGRVLAAATPQLHAAARAVLTGS